MGPGCMAWRLYSGCGSLLRRRNFLQLAFNSKTEVIGFQLLIWYLALNEAIAYGGFVHRRKIVSIKQWFSNLDVKELNKT